MESSSISEENTESSLSSDDRILLSNEEAQKSKDVITEFAEAYSADLAAERFGVSRNTVRLWLKQRKIVPPPKPVYNSPGQGRKITYSRELDVKIAEHIRGLLAKGERVTVQDVCTYARSLIQMENPDFSASTGWAQRFLARNGIDLSAQVRKLIPTARHAHLSSSAIPDNRGRPLSYSAETDNLIAEWVRNRTDRGEVITNSELRKYAREIISKQNPNFTGSASWAQNFLLRHRLSLHPNPIFFPSSNVDKTAKSDVITITQPSTDTTASVPSLQLISSQVVCEGQSQGVSVSSEATLTPPPSQTSATVPNDSLVTSSSSYSTVDDGVTSTLALLAGENIQVEGNLSQSQAATLTLSDLTSDPTLAEILGASHDPTAAGFSQAALDTPVSQLSYLSSLGHQLSELVGPTVGGGGGSATLINNLVTPPSAINNLVTPPSAAAINFTDTESVGSGTRPLSYAKETDQALANWVKEQQAAGSKVTFASLRAHAKKTVSLENPSFNASVGWVTPFLLRHNLDLKINDRRSRSTRKTINPRKLQSKGESQDELSNDEPIPMDEEGEMELQPLPIIPQLPSELISNDEQNESMVVMEQNRSQQSEDNVMEVVENNDTPPQIVEKVSTEQIEDLTPPTSKKVKVGNRSRHTLAEKLEVVRLMKEHNVAGHYVSKLLGIANSTLSGWIKLVDQKGSELVALSTNKKRSNRSGQGRPLTYSKDKDEIIAQWMKSQQEMGVSISTQELTMYATKVIQEENPNFIASVGWRHKFLQRHNLQLVKADKSSTSSQEDLQNIPLPVQTEEVCTDEYTPEVVDKEYPEEILSQLHDWTTQTVTEQGSLSLQAFCKRAEELILPVNPIFVATLGWAFKFLHKHSVMLDPRPTNVELGRKRPLSNELTPDEGGQPSKKSLTPAAAIVAAAMGLSPEGLTVSPSTGNLCEALLSLSSQSEQIVCDTSLDGTATTTMASVTTPTTESTPATQLSSAKNYFGKPAREFSSEEKEEVVRYANAMTLQKAAIKYGVAAPTVWRWRMELKLHQPKYTANQKKYIVKFAETNSVKDAASRFGITTKTIQNWKKALQLDGTLSDVEIAAIPPPSLQEMGEPSDTLTTPSTSGGLISEEVIPLDNSHFQYIVDGGEVAEGSRVQPTITGVPSTSDGADPSSLEVTHEVQVQDVGMEYDVISSEGHAAKPRCTQEEKTHILQYALDHSIKEASLKYGVSPGTLYYWKKNHGTSKNKIVTGSPTTTSNTSGSSTMADTFTGTQHHNTNLETTIVNVSVPVDIGATSSIIQTSTPVTGTVDTSGLPSFAITDAAASVLGDGAVPTASLINAITQTLASATPEQLQSLQQITSDLNLLQAVTSLLSSQEGSSSLKSIIPVEGSHSRHDSTVSNGGISSPTEVLVSFHTTNDTPTDESMTGTTDIPTDTTDIPTGTTDIPTGTTSIPTGTIDITSGTTDVAVSGTSATTSTIVTDTATTVTPVSTGDSTSCSNQSELQVQLQVLQVSSEMPLAVEEVTTSHTSATPTDDDDVAMVTDEGAVEKPPSNQTVTKTSKV